MRTIALHTGILIALTAIVGVTLFSPIQVAFADPAAQTDSVASEMAARLEAKSEYGCGVTNISGCMTYVAYFFMAIAGVVLGWAGVLLNYAVQDLVVGMGLLVGNMTGITDAWVILRDIANVFLLFLTIFIGIATILGLSSWNYKQLLWRVIVAALFVNFSLFFAKIIIDTSNLAATELYSLILVQTPDMSAECLSHINGAQFGESVCLRNGIASVFMQHMQLATVFDVSKLDDDTRSDVQWRVVWTALLGTLLYLVAAFVFAAAAFLLMGRFIALVILLIFSPVAFVALITKVSGFGRKWWSMLLSQAFFAPALFLMWWIAFKLLENLGERYAFKLPGAEGFIGAAMGSMSAIALIFYFLLIMGFLIMALFVAKSMGAYGASAAIGTGKAIAGFAGGTALAYTAGNASRAGSHVYNKIESWRKSDSSAKTEGGRAFGHLARDTLTAGRIVANVATLGATSDKVVKRGLEYGYNKKWLGSASLKDINKESAARDAELRGEHSITEAGNLMGKMAKNPDYQPTAAERALLQSLNGEQLARAGRRFGKSHLRDENVIKHLSEKQLHSVQENTESLFSEAQSQAAETFRNRYTDAANEIFKKMHTNPAYVPDTKEARLLNRLSSEQLARAARTDAGDSYLANNNVLQHLSSKHLTNVQENKDNLFGDKSSEAAYQYENRYVDAIADGLNNNTPATITTAMAKMSNKKVSELPGEWLVKDDVVANLTQAHLEQIKRNGTLGAERMGKIRHIISNSTGHSLNGYDFDKNGWPAARP